MKSYFIPHNLKVGDITNLSDKDSELIISEKLHKIEDPIEISTLHEIFLAIITSVSKSSVEVEIVDKIKDIESSHSDFEIILVQSLSNDTKFNYVIEKAIEIGIHKIVPVESKYSLVSKPKAIKKYGLWNKIINDAQQQSRNIYPVEIMKPIRIRELEALKLGTEYRLCLSTEATTTNLLNNSLQKKDPRKSFTIAIGPEKGWSSSDIEIFKALNYEFVRMGGNILRTETAGLVISSILNYRAGIY